MATVSPIDVLAAIIRLNMTLNGTVLDAYVSLDLPAEVFDELEKYFVDRALLTRLDEPRIRMTHAMGRRVYRIGASSND